MVLFTALFWRVIHLVFILFRDTNWTKLKEKDLLGYTQDLQYKCASKMSQQSECCNNLNVPTFKVQVQDIAIFRVLVVAFFMKNQERKLFNRRDPYAFGRDLQNPAIWKIVLENTLPSTPQWLGNLRVAAWRRSWLLRGRAIAFEHVLRGEGHC